MGGGGQGEDLDDSCPEMVSTGRGEVGGEGGLQDVQYACSFGTVPPKIYAHRAMIHA